MPEAPRSEVTKRPRRIEGRVGGSPRLAAPCRDNEAPLYTTPAVPRSSGLRVESKREFPGRMLFLVISEPRPEPHSSVTGQRKRYWDWVGPLQASGEAVHAKVGRGAAVLFDVPRKERPHQREWADIIPARFEVHALIDPGAARGFLDRTGGPDQ